MNGAKLLFKTSLRVPMKREGGLNPFILKNEPARQWEPVVRSQKYFRHGQILAAKDHVVLLFL